MLGYVLLTVLPLAAVVYLVWFYRKKTAERAAASRKRFSEMFGPNSKARSVPAAPPEPGAAAIQTDPVMSRSAPLSAPGVTALCVRKEHVLSGKRDTLFEALRGALPDHLIFPHVSLAALVALPPAIQGREREQRQRGLAQSTIDFVVCDVHKRAVAAIDLVETSGTESLFKAEYLKAAQLRYVQMEHAPTPDLAGLRALILQAASQIPHTAHS